MTFRAALLLVIAACATAGTSANRGVGLGAGTAEAELRELERAYNDALLRNDSASLNRIRSGEWQVVTEAGDVLSRVGAQARAARGGRVFEGIDVLRMDVRVYGRTAVVYTQARDRGMADGRPFSREAWYLDVWVNGSSGVSRSTWRLVASQVTRVAPR